MKTTITKKLFTFILLVSGMFSFSPADAQCVCFCTNNNQPKFMAECYTKPNGTLGCRPSRCRDRVASEQNIETSSLFIYPNPVSASTTVSFYVEEKENVSLKIFDVNGRLVTTLADKIFEAGENALVWNAGEVNAGIYFLRMETETGIENQKLIVAK